MGMFLVILVILFSFLINEQLNSIDSITVEELKDYNIVEEHKTKEYYILKTDIERIKDRRKETLYFIRHLEPWETPRWGKPYKRWSHRDIKNII